MPKKRSKKPTKPTQIKSKQILAGASLAGSLLLTSGSQNIKALPEKPAALRAPLGLISRKELNKLLADLIQKLLPKSSRVLTNKEEQKLQTVIKKTLGITAVAELDGNRLNHQVGYMGLEQHLMRYPDDRSLANRPFPQAGVAPGKGAWGYWTRSKATLTSQH